jgi:hypothetical protein
MILFGDDHYGRGVALAAAVGENAMFWGPNFAIPSDVPDSTLTVWGHSGDGYFCRRTNTEFCALLSVWKAANPKLTTVEIITCDARHAILDYMSAYGESIDKFLKIKKINVTVKAFPKGMRPTDSSLLYADGQSRTFCYVTSSDNESFAEISRLVVGSNENNLVTLAATLAKLIKFQPPYAFTIVGGNFENLRTYLSVVNTTL